MSRGSNLLQTDNSEATIGNVGYTCLVIGQLAELVLNVSASDLTFRLQRLHHFHEQLWPFTVQDFLNVMVAVLMLVASKISVEP
jgi:hypothetical protein